MSLNIADILNRQLLLDERFADKIEYEYDANNRVQKETRTINQNLGQADPKPITVIVDFVRDGLGNVLVKKSTIVTEQ